LATILGTLQSTLTYFPYLRKIWQKNTEEERLLGVSFTGIYDSKLMNDYNDKNLSSRLEAFRELAVITNKKFAKDIERLLADATEQAVTNYNQKVLVWNDWARVNGGELLEQR
jgi:hypothetical protein